MASRKSLALIFVALLAACSPPEDPWKKTHPAGKFAPVVIVTERFPKACPFLAIGCYVREELATATPGVIYIKPKLPPWQYECVLKHEMKHHAGYTHAPGMSDCRKSYTH